MARSRNIKPGFFVNEQLVELPFEVRLLFIGLWTLADREGRLEDRPKKIAMALFPADAVDVDVMLTELHDAGLVCRYEVEGERFIEIPNFAKHQNPHWKEPQSEIPPPKKDTKVRDPAPIERGKNPDQSETRPPFKGGEAEKSRDSTPVEKGSNPADSGSLIPDSGSLIPDSGSLIPDSLPVGAPPPVEHGSTTDAVDRVFGHWRQVHAHPRSKLDDKRRRLIKRALKNYSEADLCMAISGYRASPHHMGLNDRATVYDSIDLFLKDAEHIDAGIRFHEHPPRSDLSLETRRAAAATAGWQPPEVRNGSK